VPGEAAAAQVPAVPEARREPRGWEEADLPEAVLKAARVKQEPGAADTVALGKAAAEATAVPAPTAAPIRAAGWT
jgi:hypothetical protein